MKQKNIHKTGTLLLAAVLLSSLYCQAQTERKINGWTVRFEEPRIVFGPTQWDSLPAQCRLGPPTLDTSRIKQEYFDALLSYLKLPERRIGDSVLHVRSRHTFFIWCERGISDFPTNGIRTRDSFIVSNPALGIREFYDYGITSVEGRREKVLNPESWYGKEHFKFNVRSCSNTIKYWLNREQRKYLKKTSASVLSRSGAQQVR